MSNMYYILNLYLIFLLKNILITQKIDLTPISTSINNLVTKPRDVLVFFYL